MDSERFSVSIAGKPVSAGKVRGATEPCVMRPGPADDSARGRANLSLIRDYYYRFHVLVHEVAKFGIVGALGFVVQLGSQNALHSGFKLGPTVSIVLAYIVATVVTFVGNRYWAFKHRKGKGLGREFWMFVVLNAIAIVIQVAIVDLAYY